MKPNTPQPTLTPEERAELRKLFPISEALISTEVHKSGFRIEDVTVPNSAMDDPILQGTVQTARELFPAAEDLEAGLMYLALSAFRIGMLYERAIRHRARTPVTPENAV